MFTVAVPLVSPQLELLPVHFSTDPGADYDWQCANDCSDFDLPHDKKVRLIERYIDVKVCTMSATDNMKRLEMHRRSGSLDSAQVTSLVNSGKLEEDKKSGSTGVSRQIHGAVVRTFGSLGQSVSQKLKNITHSSKTHRFSVGTATQSSRRSTLAVKMLSNQRQVIYRIILST